MLRRDLLFKMLRSVPIWLPVRAYTNFDLIFIPQSFKITSVGSKTVHLNGHDDVDFAYCYENRISCNSRCLRLFVILTGRKIEDFPILH